MDIFAIPILWFFQNFPWSWCQPPCLSLSIKFAFDTNFLLSKLCAKISDDVGRLSLHLEQTMTVSSKQLTRTHTPSGLCREKTASTISMLSSMAYTYLARHSASKSERKTQTQQLCMRQEMDWVISKQVRLTFNCADFMVASL